MTRHLIGKLLAATAFMLAAVAQGWAAYTIEGDADALTITAEDADRAELVGAIIERFSLEVEGGDVAGGLVNGTFRGSLSEVLQSVLIENGYALAYRDGKPVRITFTRHDTGTVVTPREKDEPLAAAAAPAPEQPVAAEDETPTMGTMMSRAIRQQTMSGKGSADPAPPDGDQLNAQEITRQAVRELEVLVRSLKDQNQ